MKQETVEQDRPRHQVSHYVDMVTRRGLRARLTSDGKEIMVVDLKSKQVVCLLPAKDF